MAVFNANSRRSTVRKGCVVFTLIETLVISAKVPAVAGRLRNWSALNWPD